jgi:hypothetical protein
VSRTKNFSAYLSSLNQDISRLNSKQSIDGLNIGTVTGSSLSTDVVLENNSIQSGNYSPGIIGWKIDSNGLAEFGNVFVRGHIDAQTGSIGYWNISSPAVERRIGDRQLFGTFLESTDLGSTDFDETSGTYVALFKSYSEEGVSITHRFRFNNVATLTAPSHGFQNGDYVNIEMYEEVGISDGIDIAFSSGESAVRIFDVTNDTFSYINFGTDLTAITDEDEIEFTSSYGIATLYIKDVAGLYLQDYGKALFDYGYFSNEGISYVSAETPNLVYNPSFEVIQGGVNYFVSSPPWAFTPKGDYVSNGVTFYEFSVDNKYSGDSVYGALVHWDDEESESYVNAQVNLEDFKRLGFFKNDRELFFSFDMFFVHELVKVTIPTTGSFVTTSSSVVTITCPGHGLAVDDLVYFDFQTQATGYGNYITQGRIQTVLSVNGDSFTVANQNGQTTANPITLTPYASADPCIFKYVQPVFDLNDIKIGFDTGTTDEFGGIILDRTTSLYDILTDVTIASWEDYRYWSHSSAEFENWYFFTETYSASAPYRPISSMGVTELALLDGDGSTKQVVNIKISSSKLERIYRSTDYARFRDNEEFYICFPASMWEGTRSDGNTAPVKREVKATNYEVEFGEYSMGYILDNVSLSPSKKFFFGDSGSSAFYYKRLPTEIDIIDFENAKKDKVSYEAPRKWIDIDLDYQTAQFNYIDSIEFKSADFLKQLFANPSITTIKDTSSSLYGLNGNESLLIGESSRIKITSGQYKYIDEGNIQYRTIEAYSSQETGSSSALYELKAVSSATNFVTGEAGSILQLSVASDDTGSIRGFSDSIYFMGYNGVTLTSGAFPTSASIQLLTENIMMYTGSSNASFQINSNGAGFYNENTYQKVLGLNANNLIEAAGVLDNELTSNYRTVYIDNNFATLGYVSSSIDTKKNVEQLNLTAETVLQAEPVQFNYKSEKDGLPKHAGFIAEQLVESGLGGYVSFDADGKPVTVNYEMFVSALQLVARHHAAQIAELNSRLSALEG